MDNRKSKIYIAILFVISVSILGNYGVSLAESYPGFIAPQKKSSSKSTSPLYNSSTTTTKSKKTQKQGIFSFISSKFGKDKKQKQQAKTKKEEANQNFQGYKSYDSYDSYYKEKQKGQQKNSPDASPLQQQQQPIPQAPSNIAAPIQNTPQQTQAISNKLTPVQKDILSKINIRSAEGLPKTAVVKRKIIAAIERLEDKTKRREIKRERLQKDIEEFNSLMLGLQTEIQQGDTIYRQLEMPENYIAQVKEDNQSALELIKQALEKFNRY